MALRGSPRHRLVGNPLGGVLRETDRRARSTTRRAGRRASAPEAVAEPVPGPPGPPGPLGRPGAPGPAAAAAIVTTGPDGVARWEFPVPYEAPPVLTAAPAGPGVLLAVVEHVTGAVVTIRVYRLGAGDWPAPAEGVNVHCTATASSP